MTSCGVPTGVLGVEGGNKSCYRGRFLHGIVEYVDPY